MATDTPTPIIFPLQGDSELHQIVHLLLVEVGVDKKMIEEFKQKIVMSCCKPKASIMEACLTRVKNTVERVYSYVNFNDGTVPAQKVDATELELLQGIYVSTVLVPDLNSPPVNCWTLEEVVAFCKRENTVYLSKFGEACLVQVGMEREAQDFKERVKAAAGFENSEAVKLWNNVTLLYMIQKVLKAAGLIEDPEIPMLPPLNAIFPTPESVGWNRPERKEGPSKSKGVIIIEDCGGRAKRKAVPAHHAAGPSSLKKNKTVVFEVDSSSSTD